MNMPWRGTTEEISAEVESRYETPGGAQEKVNSASKVLDDRLQYFINQSGDSVAEIVDARFPAEGPAFDNMRKRLNDSDVKVKDTIIDLNDREVNVKVRFGAIGDGNSHPLSDFFPTLALGQIKYPAATSLNDEVDWCALQACISYCFENRKTMFIPKGFYLINNPLTVYTRFTETGGINNPLSQSDWVHIRSNSQNTIIKKTTSNSIDGKDCIVFITPQKTSETSGQGLWIENLTFIGTGTGQYGVESNTNPYGFYFNTSIFSIKLDKLMIRNVDVGINQTNFMAMGNYTHVYCWTKTTGFLLSNTSSTSNHFVNCYAQLQSGYGFKLSGGYSSLLNCGADGISGTAYGLFSFGGSLISCGSENSNGYCVYEIDGGHVSILGCSGLANIYDKVGCRSFYVKNNAYVRVIGGSLSATGIVSGIPSQINPSGKLFVTQSNGRIYFEGFRRPVLPYKEDSDWSGLQRTKFINALPGEIIYNPTTKRTVSCQNDGSFVDSLGNPAVRYDMLYNNVLKQTFTPFTAVTGFSMSQSGSGIVINGSNNASGATANYYVTTKINMSNLKYVYMRISAIFGLASWTDNYLEYGLQSPEQLGTTSFTGASGYIQANVTDALVLVNVSTLNLMGDYYLTFRAVLSNSVTPSITATVKNIVLSDIAGITV